jgi:hypothetical protein
MAIVTSRGKDPSVVHSTPRAVTRALLEHLHEQPYTTNLLQRGAAWDCACGSMAIVRELLAPPPPMLPARAVVSSDIHLRDGASIAKPLDFTTTTPPDNLAHRPQFVVTNPPFSLATQFMEKGLNWISGVPYAAMALFLPVGALGGQLRAQTVYTHSAPSQILVLSERVDIFPDGYVPPPDDKHRGGVIEYAWFLWYNDPHGDLLTYTEQAALDIPPFAWVQPGTLARLDPEAAQAKADRATANRKSAAARSQAKKKRATLPVEHTPALTPEEP